MGLYLIAALGQQGQMGLNGELPWPRLKRDIEAFKHITCAREPIEIAEVYTGGGFVCFNTDKTDNAVIMGRRTFESLPGPLEGRINIILSSSLAWESKPEDIPPGVIYAETLRVGLNEATITPCEHTFIIGGAQVYAEALRLPQLEALFLTEVDYTGEADTWWPQSLVSFNEGMMTIFGDAIKNNERWRRTRVSPWIEELERPRYRLGIWERDKI